MKSFTQFLAESPKPLTLADFSPILGLTDPRSLQTMDRIIMTFVNLTNSAINTGSVLKSGLKDLGSAANRIADVAFEQLSAKYLHGGKYQELPKELAFFDFKPSHIGLVTSSLKKAEALKVNHQYKTDAITVLKNLLQAEAIVAYFKQHVGTKETKADREARQAFEAPKSTKDAKKLVADVLTQVTNSVKHQYIEQLEQPWIRDVKDFFAKEHLERLRHIGLHPEQVAERKRKNDESRAAHQAHYGNTWGWRAEGRMAPFIERTLLPVAANHQTINGEPVWTPKPNWEHLLHEMAVREAEEMQQSFIAKNVSKLASIVEVKNNIDGDPKVLSAHCTNGTIESNIQFRFRDTSKFTVRNKIVRKWYEGRNGQYSVMFQFPTTFHDARLPNGLVMKGQPSEEQMNKIFAVAKG